MAEINTTPLVDVMLVLLIIFIITAPLMTHSVAVDLPRVSSRPTPEKPMKLTVAIDAHGHVFIGAEAIGRDQLEARFRAAVVSDAGVEMHFQADRNTRYEIIAETMALPGVRASARSVLSRRPPRPGVEPAVSGACCLSGA